MEINKLSQTQNAQIGKAQNPVEKQGDDSSKLSVFKDCAAKSFEGDSLSITSQNGNEKLLAVGFWDGVVGGILGAFKGGAEGFERGYYGQGQNDNIGGQVPGAKGGVSVSESTLNNSNIFNGNVYFENNTDILNRDARNKTKEFNVKTPQGVQQVNVPVNLHK